MANYTLSYGPLGRTPSFVITVRDGIPVEIRGRDGRTRNPDRMLDSQPVTVCEFFDFIDSYAGADLLLVEHDPEAGFPTRFVVDPDADASDDGSGWFINVDLQRP